MNTAELGETYRREGATAIVVRGMDEHGFFGAEEAPSTDLEPKAVEAWREVERRAKQNFMTER